tara:strand:+ start:594 stop:935 length:342 start_codon:yes stop_codon:yes gene_type:complete
LASPRDVIARNVGAVTVAKLAREEGVVLILIGMPYLPSGVKGTQAVLTEKFISDLTGLTRVPIKTVDERMSTIEASQMLAQSPHSKKRIRKNKGILDSASAAIILQAYLDSQM